MSVLNYSRNLFLIFTSLVLLITLFTCASGTKRNISCTKYPQLTDSGSDSLNLVHVRADSLEDTVHYLWSSYHLPSVIVSRTTTDTEVQLDVNKLRTFQNGAITFSKSPLALIGLTISELWRLYYETDVAPVNKASSIEKIDLPHFHWSNVTNQTLSCSDHSATLKFTGFNADEAFSQNGLFEMQFSVLGDEEAASDFPHLVYTGNSTQIKIGLDDFYSKNSTRVRYGLEMSMFTLLPPKCSNMDCKPVTTRFISDEFSPGIFSEVHIFPPCSEKDNEKGSFLTWRPVAYTSKEPSVANSSDVQLTSDCSFTSIAHVQSIAELYFNDKNSTSVNIFNITFGSEGDGFYPKTKYSSWSLMLGTGVSAETKLSITAIVFMIIGAAMLVAFSLLGVSYYVVRWFRKKDDDSLLGDSSINY